MEQDGAGWDGVGRGGTGRATPRRAAPRRYKAHVTSYNLDNSIDHLRIGV